MEESNENEKIRKTLSLETQNVYNYFLQKNPHELALGELSQHLKLSKPSILHHLQKLLSIEAIEQSQNGYRLKQVIKISIVKGYRQTVKRLLLLWLPFLVIFSSLATVSVSYLLYLNFILGVFVLVVSCIGLVVSLLTLRQNL